MQLDFKCVVIGAGPAGMTAAIYLKRFNLDVAILEKGAPGGQMTQTGAIENYPGFESIDGPNLSMTMFNQVQKLGVVYKYGKVIDIINKGDYKIIKTDMEEITCESIIIATGRVPKELGLENERSLTGRGVSWCAICDGIFYKDEDIAVVGGGNSALEEALHLSEIGKEVTIIHRRDTFRGDDILVEKVKNKDNINIIYNATVDSLNEFDNKLESINVKTPDGIIKLETKGMFIFIGYEPDASFLRNLEIKLEDDYIVVDQNMRTNVEKIYACGDIIKKEVYQISTAVGEGTIAAISASKDLS